MVDETPYAREDGYARRYRDVRFRCGSGPATHRREARALEALLRAAGAEPGRWLDVPCGAGRFAAALPAGAVLADRDPAMVRAVPDALAADRLAASAHRLPFADRTFAGIVCLRLLHHLPTATERRAVLTELRRVSRGPLIASFFDAHSLQHLRRLIARRLGKTRSGRCAASRAEFLADLRAAGWRPRRLQALRRWLSEQTLVLADPGH